jgi:hypothetical protein
MSAHGLGGRCKVLRKACATDSRRTSNPAISGNAVLGFKDAHVAADAVSRVSPILSLARATLAGRRNVPRPAEPAVRCWWGVCRRCDRRYPARCWFDPQRVPGRVTPSQPQRGGLSDPVPRLPTIPAKSRASGAVATIRRVPTSRSTPIIEAAPRSPSRRQHSISTRLPRCVRRPVGRRRGGLHSLQRPDQAARVAVPRERCRASPESSGSALGRTASGNARRSPKQVSRAARSRLRPPRAATRARCRPASTVVVRAEASEAAKPRASCRPM